MRIKLDDAQAREFGHEDELELDGFEYVLYSETDEINELKHVHWDRIFERSDGKYFLQSCSKSGSYWSDYEYDFSEELCEVKQVEVIKLEWKLV